MRRYKWSDMLYSYDWLRTEKSNPLYKAIPGTDNFNRKSGHAVLFLINTFMEQQNSVAIAMGNKLEYLLHERLPSSKMSLTETMSFLQENF